MTVETALIDWKAIAEMFGVTERTMKARRKELLEQEAIFYTRHGRPPRIEFALSRQC